MSRNHDNNNRPLEDTPPRRGHAPPPAVIIMDLYTVALIYICLLKRLNFGRWICLQALSSIIISLIKAKRPNFNIEVSAERERGVTLETP